MNDVALLEKVLDCNTGDELYVNALMHADLVKTSGLALQSEYDFGPELSVPEKKIVIDGREIVLKSQVLFPDGTASQKTKVSLTQSGLYEVRYAAVYNEKPYLIVES